MVESLKSYDISASHPTGFKNTLYVIGVKQPSTCFLIVEEE